MDGVSNPRNIVEAIKLSIHTASGLYEYANDVKNAKSDMKNLGGEIKVHLSILSKAKDLLESHSGRLQVSQKLRPALDANYSELENIKVQLDKQLEDNSSIRKKVSNRLRWSSQKHKIEYDIEKLRKTREDIWSALNIDNANTIMDIHSVQSDEILSKLQVVQGAAFDSHANEHEPQCHPLTRVKILGEIENWAQEPEGRRIYWLCGMAGTGKSTICRTVAHHLTRLNIVTASFFFKKGDNDRDKSSALFTTIVKQLVEHLPKEMASHVKKALQDNPSIGDKVLSKQFEKLILEPLQSCRSLPPVIIVVLDALDECEDQASAAKIIELLPSIGTVSSTCFKVLVASRPECHLRTSFAHLECKYHEVFLYEALHEVADEDIQKDISVFFEFQLGQIRDSHNLTSVSLPADWPSRSLVDALVNISVPLFILAATACRFIGDRDLGAPTALAQEFLQHHRQLGARNPLAKTYLPILEQLLVKRSGAVPEIRSKAEKEKIIANFRRVIGTIVLLEAPLSVTSISKLLQMDPADVNLRLSGLNSVLNIPKASNSPVKLFHLSFRDLLVGTGDQDEDHDFLIDEQEINANLASQCIALLSRDDNLKQDICGLNHPGKLRSNIDQDTIDTCLPPHVRYACLHWVFHLKESQGRIRFDDETHRFLTTHLIHWLEALSLLGRIAESGGMVESLLAIVDDTRNDGVFGLLRDAKRFVSAYRHIIDVAPLQIYSSVLMFAPKRCEFRRCFEEAIPKWIKHRPTVPMDWDRCLQTLEGHNEAVYQAIFSPDNSLIASRGYQKIIIWRSHAGTCIHEINALANAIAFSPDGRFLYSFLSNGQVETRETDTWTRKAVMKVDVPTGATWVSTAAFSHDCKLVAVAFDTSIEIRSISTPGDFAKSIKWDRPYTTSLMFSPDSAYIAALSSKLLNIWPIRGGQPNLIEHCSAVAYSPDSSLMALSLEKVIEIRRTDGGFPKPHRKYFVKDGHNMRVLSFSHDAALLAISSGDNKLEIWSTEAAKRIWTANDHGRNISSVSFSHDSAFLISSSIDGTLRIYSVNDHQSLEVHERKYREVGPITISPDSSLVLLQPGGGNKIWQIMHADSGICAGEFDRARLQSEPTFTHDSTLAVIKGGMAEIWHSDGHQSAQSLDGLGPHPSGLRAACFSEDFTLVAGILDDKSLRIWQMNTGECICEIHPAVLYGHELNRLCFSPDTSRIACARDGEDEDDIFVWQVESRALVQSFTVSKGITSFAMSNTKLAAAPFDAWPKTSIWNLETGDILQHCENEAISTIYKLSFSHDSTILVGVLSQTISIWNADTGARVQTYHAGLNITHLSFEPNDNSRLRTNLGRIKLKDFAALSEDAANSNQVQSWYYDKLHITNNDDDHNGGSWITYNGENLLWLPANYRGDHGISRAVSESLAAIVSWRSGQHTFIGFDMEKIPGWYHDIHRQVSCGTVQIKRNLVYNVY